MKAFFTRIVALTIATLFFNNAVVFSQITITADSVQCGDTATTLRATLLGQTPINTGITIDDTWAPTTNALGFNFNFYGTTYGSCVVGANGCVTFDTSLTGAYFPWSITAALLGNTAVLNSVCGPWCDIDVTGGGTITYATVGTAPNRKFVVDFCHDAMYSCTSQWTTSQIVLYETSNIADVYIAHKTVCSTWNGGYAIVGVQDQSGTRATPAPGRDYPSVWSGFNEGWRFTPDATFSTYTASSVPFSPVPFATSTIYWFDSSTGAMVGTGPTLNVVPHGPRTYIAAAAGCDDTSFAYYHVVLSDLVSYSSGTRVAADFNIISHPGCIADTIELVNTSTPTGMTSVWDYGDGSPLDSSSASPRHVYLTQGTYTVKLVYKSSAGCADSISKTVTFNHNVTSGFTPSATSVCLGSVVNFTNTSTGAANYSWDFGDGTTSFSANPSHTFVNAGIYAVKLISTDSIPCSATSTATIEVVSIEGRVYPRDTTVCLKTPMAITSAVRVVPASASGSIVYAWSPATNLDNASVPNPNFFGVGDFTYTFTATVNPLGCSITDIVNIHSKPPLSLVNITPDQLIALGSSVQLSVQGAYTYYWTPNNGTLDNPNINNPVATPTDTMTVYRVVGSTLFGCKDTAYITVRVDQFSTDNIPTAFTPNGDGINDVFRIVGLRFQKLVDFRIYDRWGREVFATSDLKQGWDGTYKGEPQDMGVFNYQVIISYPDSKQKAYKGTVTLIR